MAENNIGVINSIKPIISVSERVVNIDEVISKSIVENDNVKRFTKKNWKGK